jgi:hypothetical protein
MDDDAKRDCIAEERLRLEVDRQFPDDWIDDPQTQAKSGEHRVTVELPLSVVKALKERARKDRSGKRHYVDILHA